jgi:hypothetical protein
VLALLVLARPGEAFAEARAGNLHPGWWAFTAAPTPSTPAGMARTAVDG